MLAFRIVKSAPNIHGRNADVIVIGAGIAGLALAERLINADIHTIVLEARHEIGGRIRTKDVHWGRSASPIAEGAEFIHSDPHSTNMWNEILKKHRLTTDEIAVNGQTILGGRLLHDVREESPASGTMMSELIENIQRHLAAGGNDMRVESFLQTYTLRSVPDREHRALLRTLLSNEYGEDAGVLSIRTLLETDSYTHKNYRIHEGFSALTSSIAEHVTDIRTDTAVKCVRWQRGKVAVETGKGSILTAGACAATVPIGMLQKGLPSFEAPLPPEKLKAIESLLPGRVTKVIMEFRERFWNPQMNFLRGGKQQFSWPPLVHHDKDAPYLNALVGGSQADVLAAMGQGAAARKIAREIMAAHDIKNPRQLFVNGATIAWHKERYIRTGYSSLDVDAAQDVRETLGQPIDDTLFFAGEATSTQHPGTVTGAIESAYRTAEEIIASRR